MIWYQKWMNKFKKIPKSNFGFLFNLDYFNYSELLYAIK
jgi:hypothetical protein